MEKPADRAFSPDYIPAHWTGENTSGLRPYGNYVLVRVDESSGRLGSILTTDDRTDISTAAAVTGAIFGFGPYAFKGHPGAPEIGDRVYIVKYSGTIMTGMDGGNYRILEDHNIIGGLDERGKAAMAEAA